MWGPSSLLVRALAVAAEGQPALLRVPRSQLVHLPGERSSLCLADHVAMAQGWIAGARPSAWCVRFPACMRAGQRAPDQPRARVHRGGHSDHAGARRRAAQQRAAPRAPADARGLEAAPQRPAAAQEEARAAAIPQVVMRVCVALASKRFRPLFSPRSVWSKWRAATAEEEEQREGTRHAAQREHTHPPESPLSGFALRPDDDGDDLGEAASLLREEQQQQGGAGLLLDAGGHGGAQQPTTVAARRAPRGLWR